MSAPRLDRVQKIQIIKRRKRRFLLFGLLFALTATLALVSFGSRADFWTIQNIEVSGFPGDTSSIESIVHGVLSRNRFLILSGTNAIIFNRQGVSDDIQKAVVSIKNVSVSRIGLHTVHIDVVLREPLIIVKGNSENDAFVSDDDGVVFESAANAPDLPMLVLEQSISLGARIDVSQKIRELSFFVNQARVSGVVIKELHPTKGRLDCILDSGVTLIIDPTHDLARSLRGVEVLARELTKTGEWPSFLDKVEYIDLRELPKVFYKEKKQ
jgi:cell division septal protein FtsQ